ncbi:AraC family transcriptional regulator [Lacihabitans sp. LS3-19]|uniref:helix-turn-helix domain-containing protein n=1 Tax=Lacihabitans sp. LS3-19 TaxID=2487335 RepID=UPI0020CC4300|nr:helix-turn-helix domain-containing protein [Lacihabitans sp. LS3-19]MCP9770516.1 AraC family transcriptional regulator [Lacihabitans sp. LS3-19]
MDSEKVIPILSNRDLEEFHFGNVEWNLPLSQTRHLFHINRLEDFRDKMTFPFPPHRKLVIDLIFITEGESIRSKGLSEYAFKANQFFFLPAFQITEHKMMSEKVKGFFLHFSLELFQEFSLHRTLEGFTFLDFLSNPIVTVDEKAKRRIIELFHQLEDFYPDFTSKDHQAIVFKILSILTEANRFVEKEKTKTKNASGFLVQQFKDALSEQIYKYQKVSEYADLLSVTPNHLNKCVKLVTNKTAQEILNEMLILEAKSLLKYSNFQIAEVAVRLCNQNPSNFSRFFRSQTGLSPKEYQML